MVSILSGCESCLASEIAVLRVLERHWMLWILHDSASEEKMLYNFEHLEFCHHFSRHGLLLVVVPGHMEQPGPLCRLCGLLVTSHSTSDAKHCYGVDFRRRKWTKKNTKKRGSFASVNY